MTISANDVLNSLYLIAPQFQTTDPVQLDMYYNFINVLQCQVNPSILSCCGALTFAFLLAHYLTLQTNPTLGMQSNMSEGQLSVGFNVNPEINALNLTPYGRSYLDLVRRTVVGSFVTNLPLSLGGISNGFPATTCGCNGPGFGVGGNCC